MSDDGPDYPPGPRGPEELGVPGVRVEMSREQLEFAARELATHADATSVRFEERGAAYLELTLRREGKQLHQITIFPVPAEFD